MESHNDAFGGRAEAGLWHSTVMLGLLAQVAFWVLLLFGVAEIGLRRVALFVMLWGIGYLVSRSFMVGSLLFTSYVAVLDIVLVLLVFKGDVRGR